jgi:hypothetical protein
MVGNRSRELWGHTSSSVAYCEITYEKGWTKGINHCSWTFKNKISLNKKANMIVDCLENQITFHDLCDENHEWQVETRAQALLASVDNTPLGKVRPCNTHKLANSMKLREACGLDGIQNKCFRHHQRALVQLTHLFNHCLRLSHLPKPWKEAKVLMLPSNDPKLPQNLSLISLLPTSKQAFWESYSENSPKAHWRKRPG